MSEYKPDKWILVELVDPKGERVVKVLAGWSGGYLDADSWKLSSGVTKVEDGDTHWLIHNYSGSVYKCHKKMQGVTLLSDAILQDIIKVGGGQIDIMEVIDD